MTSTGKAIARRRAQHKGGSADSGRTNQHIMSTEEAEAWASSFLAQANEWVREQEKLAASPGDAIGSSLNRQSWRHGGAGVMASTGGVGCISATRARLQWGSAAKWRQWEERSALWSRQPEICAAYLRTFGYQAASLEKWRSIPSAAVQELRSEPLELRLSIVEEGGLESPHVEQGGCTWYRVDCVLGPVPGKQRQLVAWRAPRRLFDLRDSLHDSVKEMFAEAYATHFAATPFARFGAPRGTTARLREWLGTLARLINDGKASPAVTARTLKFFQAPNPVRHATQKQKHCGAKREWKRAERPCGCVEGW